MAESAVKEAAANEGEEENVEENIENKGPLDTDMDMFALAELNLILVLSSLSLSSEECPNLKGKSVENRKEKHKVSTLQTRRPRPEINELRSAKRQISRVHTNIRDCRHCRRM
ncbi:uncharacterized protein LOC111410385 [Olea europaea var. sylvestris]|uniref:uncharacterized protein LOC111410385 n=1 Tax=Olea europaea var. sylvestris TaxID=158386 RepID=UPI000C1D539F|nr:uncharacterized protein LOC111410385 [Olea europaea var. sylvestris]